MFEYEKYVVYVEKSDVIMQIQQIYDYEQQDLVLN